jgi:hypothetical protein
MWLALRSALLLGLLAAGSFGPGLLVTSRLRFSPLEKLVGALAVSWIALYLAGFGIFLVGAPRFAAFAVSALGAAACVRERATLRLFARDKVTRGTLLCFFGLVAWAFLHLALVRHYGGAWWGGDWLEHAQRTAFFMGELPRGGPPDYAFLFAGGYVLPARPPLQNVLAAFFCRQLDQRFEFVSLAFLVMNAAAFVPCSLLLARFARRGRAQLPLLAALLAVNPFFLENVTLTWTKLFAAFYVLAGFWFYLRSGSKAGACWMVMAGVCFAAGALVHYSAIPFVLAVVVHFAWERWRGRPGPAWASAAAAAAVAAALFMTWLGFALARWGLRPTFLSNTAVADAAGRGMGGSALKVALNLFYTLVPYPLRGAPLVDVVQERAAGWVRDAAFLVYQTNLLVMPGLVGGPLALLLFWRRRRETFWRLVLPLGVVLAVASHGGLELFGVGHVVLQPVALLAITLLAAGLPSLPPVLRLLAAFGCAVDFGLGVLLHFHLQNEVFVVTKTAAGLVRLADGRGLLAFAAASWWQKQSLGIVFWGDHFASFSVAIEGLLAIGGLALAFWIARRLA